MEEFNKLLAELGVSKVRLAKYLGVSRQMLYNYLGLNSLDEWPKEKSVKLLSLLNIDNAKNIESIDITGEYIVEVEARLNDGIKEEDTNNVVCDLKNFNKKEQDILSDIINLLKEKLKDDRGSVVYTTYTYLYHLLQAMENTKEIKYILAYMSKSLGFCDPMEFIYNKDEQYIFESILFSAMTLYNNNGGTSKTRIAESHKRFVEDINQKNEEKLSRTQELNTAKVQALKELGYTEINESNAKEVLEKIAEIQSRKV